MRRALLSLVAVASLSQSASSQAAVGEPMFLTVHSADSSRVAEMKIGVSGQLFAKLGVVRDTRSSLHLQGSGGRASGMLQGELSDKPGELVFSSSILGPMIEIAVWPQSGAVAPQLTAKGRTVRVTRHPSGMLSVSSGI